MKLLFSGGIKWLGGESNTVLYLNYPHYRDIGNGKLRYARKYGKDVLQAINHAQENGYEIITADKFLKNPSIIEDWKKPKPEITHNIDGHEFSESTIKTALKAHSDWE